MQPDTYVASVQSCRTSYEHLIQRCMEAITHLEQGRNYLRTAITLASERMLSPNQQDLLMVLYRRAEQESQAAMQLVEGRSMQTILDMIPRG